MESLDTKKKATF